MGYKVREGRSDVRAVPASPTAGTAPCHPAVQLLQPRGAHCKQLASCTCAAVCRSYLPPADTPGAPPCGGSGGNGRRQRVVEPHRQDLGRSMDVGPAPGSAGRVVTVTTVAPAAVRDQSREAPPRGRGPRGGGGGGGGGPVACQLCGCLCMHRSGVSRHQLCLLASLEHQPLETGHLGWRVGHRPIHDAVSAAAALLAPVSGWRHRRSASRVIPTLPPPSASCRPSASDSTRVLRQASHTQPQPAHPAPRPSPGVQGSLSLQVRALQRRPRP